MMLCKNPRGPWGPREGKVFIPLRGISHGMQGTQKPMNQDYVNQIERGGDAPAQENRGAPGAQAVRAPQDYEIVSRYITAGLYSEFAANIAKPPYDVKIAVIDLTPLYYTGEPSDKSELHNLTTALLKYYHLEPIETIVLNPDAETYVTCKDNNLICYLLRALGVDSDKVRESTLAKEIPIPVPAVDDFPDFNTAEIHNIDVRDVEKIALAAARYAIEQLHVEDPAIIIIMEGYMVSLTIAKRGDEA